MALFQCFATCITRSRNAARADMANALVIADIIVSSRAGSGALCQSVCCMACTSHHEYGYCHADTYRTALLIHPCVKVLGCSIGRVFFVLALSVASVLHCP
jgi:hypothetical protein